MYQKTLTFSLFNIKYFTGSTALLEKCQKWVCFHVKYAHIHISMLCGSAHLFSSSRYK